MTTTSINNKSVQCNLVLEKQIESGDLKLLQKRSKLVQCKLSQCKVQSSTKDLTYNHSDLTLPTDILVAILRKNSHNTNTLRLQSSMQNFSKSNIQ